MENNYTLGDLPVELLHLIASNGKEVYRALALVGIQKFFVTLTQSIMTDYRIKFGHSVVITNASIRWYVNRVPHRTDGPAVEWVDGDKEWYTNGKLHRDGDKPAVERSNGKKEWWIFGNRHRMNGPAVEYTEASVTGKNEWWLFGNYRQNRLYCY